MSLAAETVATTVREIVDARRIIDAGRGRPLELASQRLRNRCPAIRIVSASRRYHWALQMGDAEQDWLPILRDLPTPESLRRLPDYLVFMAPPEAPDPKRKGQTGVLVLSCELKSSDGAIMGSNAARQVGLGMLYASYLVSLALFRLGLADAALCAFRRGLIVSPTLPAALSPRGGTKPGNRPWVEQPLPPLGERVTYALGGSDVVLEAVFG